MAEKRLSFPFLLVSTLLTLALGTWVLSAALSHTIGKPEQAQDLLNRSGIYQAVIPSQVADAQKANPSLQALPLDNPDVQKVLGQSLDSQKLQEQGNKAVGAVYAWLEGKSSKPQIDITVAPDQQDLAQAAGNYAYQFASKLPACAPGESDYSSFAADPLSATCLPRGMDPAMVRSSVENTVVNNQIEPTHVTGSDVKLWNGKTVMDSFTTAPKWYQRAQKLPFISAAVSAVCILLLLLILGVRQGIQSTGKHLLSVGIVLALVAIGLTWLFDKFYSSFFPKSSNPNIASAINNLSNLFDTAYRDSIVRLCAYMAIAGAALLAAAFLLKLAHRKAPRTVPAPSRPATPVSEPESLSASPTASSFTPSGPPNLPTTAKAAVSNDKPIPKKRAARKKAAPKKAAVKKPVGTRHKKKAS